MLSTAEKQWELGVETLRERKRREDGVDGQQKITMILWKAAIVMIDGWGCAEFDVWASSCPYS
jgi:hypothetical protein